MFCPKCGKMNPDDGELCSGCGATLHESEPNKPKKKSSTGKIIAIIAAAAVAVGGSAAALTQCGHEDAPVIAEACYIMLI